MACHKRLTEAATTTSYTMLSIRFVKEELRRMRIVSDFLKYFKFVNHRRGTYTAQAWAFQGMPGT